MNTLTAKTWIITGASSQISQEFAQLAAQNHCNLLLIGRRADELTIIAADLQLRYRISCNYLVIDFSKEFAQVWNELLAQNTEFSLFIAHSLIVENQELTPGLINALIQTNVTSTVQLLYTYFLKSQKNHEVLFLSSVAASRGRAKNSLYGASKNAIEIYIEGLQQQATPSQHITIARLGFIDTIQTYGVPGIFYASPPKACAKACWSACMKKKRLIYHPFFWQGIMGIIKRLPFFIYKRMKV